MRINADFSTSAFARTTQMEWVKSPTPGVQRRMLDRVGGEVARATSLVRYAPESRFPEHTHGGGEEFLVLEGVFSDEHGDYPAGTYVRNPPGSSHAPSSEPGCVLFVKLRQFAEDDTGRVVVDTNSASWHDTGIAGISCLPLHQHGSESVSLIRLEPGSTVPEHLHEGGEESLLLEGDIIEGSNRFIAGDWARLPHGSSHTVRTVMGCVLYVKSGHLPPADLDQYD